MITNAFRNKKSEEEKFGDTLREMIFSYSNAEYKITLSRTGVVELSGDGTLIGRVHAVLCKRPGGYQFRFATRVGDLPRFHLPQLDPGLFNEFTRAFFRLMESLPEYLLKRLYKTCRGERVYLNEGVETVLCWHPDHEAN